MALNRCGPWLVISLLTACTTLSRHIEIGESYHHVVFTSDVLAANDPIHIYIEGDGRPFIDRNTAARDPTPRRPSVLNLMRIDPKLSIA